MDRTDALIVDAFRRLLEETPLNKITVKMIVDQCGLNRNTFYYHFQDIPSLVQAYLREEADRLIADCRTAGHPMDILRPMIRHFSEHRRASLHIYRYIPREAFLEHLNRMADYFVRKILEEGQARFPISEADVDALVLYYKGAGIGIFLDWLDSGLSYDMEAKAERICALMEGTAELVVRNSLRDETEIR